ncbi:hypothetical protein [Prochlorococcus marinus]|uniref:hypothetical protein n=1 Tax=Prochlorococcus marinus TaxID=1219 RepID=UPI0022B4EC8F|nr:hypothetical protein [Prochlorococcus marinus]
MKKLLSLALGLLLFFCPLEVQSEEIADSSSPDPMSKEVIRFLQGEDIYQGTLSWQGNKALTKFNYDKPKKK